MIDKAKIEQLVNEKIEGTDMFIVDIAISTDNKISITMDADSSLNIDDCISISRQVESNLDREEEDFALDVASAGVGLPLQLPRQYKKNIGREIEIITNEGIKHKGILKSSDETSFILETSRKEKIPGKKKKQVIVEELNFLIEDIKSTKIVVSFK